MLDKDTKKKIDDARDTLVGVLPLPTDQIELITIALIYKFMDDQDEELRQVGLQEKFFTGELKEFSWQQLMSNQLSADQRVTKFINGIEAIQKAKQVPNLFREIFLNAFLKFRDGKVLQRFLDIINGFTYDHSEELGNSFEYLLMTMGAQGDNGQFRTPRNIIDFIVEVVDPQKDETILDPACGTGGFLVSAFKHILKRNTAGYETAKVELENYVAEGIPVYWGAKLSSSERNTIEKNIVGYDNTPLMVRLARVNLYLHHFGNPQIHEYNTLITDTRWKDKYDCILANPPFMTPKGGIEPHDKFRIPANRTEILFSSYILQHLNPDGKAGFIVPEGIIFTTNDDNITLRKWLLYEAGLWAVVSLPSNVFQPYSGVKTSILFIDKEVARKRNEVLLLKIENDGFSLNTNRNKIKDNDLPEALKWLELCKINKDEFVKQIGLNKDQPFFKKIQFLNRDEFAKLDAYKSGSLAFNYCSKLYESVIKIKAETEEKIKEDAAKKDKIKEKLDKKLTEFFKSIAIDFLPENKDALKNWFDANIKENAIDFGVNLTNGKLPEPIKQYIEMQRDFNMSFDKFTNEKVFNDNIDYVRIEDVCTVFCDGDWIEKADQSEYGIRLIQTGNVGFGKFKNKDIEKARYISEETFERLNCTEIFEGDILISRLPDPVGRACKIPKLKERLITAVDCTILRFDETRILPDYFLYLTLTDEYYKRINESITGASRKRISRTNLGNLLIPLPDMETQEKIVSEISSYQNEIENAILKVSQLETKSKDAIENVW
jgi:type I restriction-modification system DNA methylase subunit